MSIMVAVLENIRHPFPTLSLSISLHNHPNIYLNILFLFLQFSMIVSIYLSFTVLWFIWTAFLHVLGVLFGLMTTRLNKCYYYYMIVVVVVVTVVGCGCGSGSNSSKSCFAAGWWSPLYQLFGPKDSVSVLTRAFCYRRQTTNTSVMTARRRKTSWCWSVGLIACWSVASMTDNMAL